MSDIYEFIKGDWGKQDRLTVMEIGCAMMEDTARMAGIIRETGKDYEYHAFEPDPRNVDICRKAKCFDLVDFTPAAIGSNNRRVEFHQSSGKNPTYGYDHSISGSLKEPKEHLQAHPWCKFDTTIKVPMMRLDDYAALWSIEEVDFIWCDVQGAEDLVLEGAQNTLCKTRFFYTEYYNNEMYAGQLSLEEIYRRLPGTWKVRQTWPNDVLFEKVAI